MRHAVPLERADGVGVDLHWLPHRTLGLPGMARAFPRLPWEAGLAPDEWWTRAVPMRLGQVPALRPSAADLLLHACVHGAAGGRSTRLRWVADATAVLRTLGDEMDWDGLVGQAARRRVDLTLAAALAQLRSLGEPVPAATVAALRRARAGPRARLAHRLGTHPRPRPVPVLGYLPNTAARYVLLTRHESIGDVARGVPGFLQAAWSVDGPADLVARAAAKARRQLRATAAGAPGTASHPVAPDAPARPASA